MNENSEATASGAESERVKFHYHKAPDYRTMHCDGALGAVTPRHYLAMTLYNERLTIPREMSRAVVETTDTGFTLGEERVDQDIGGVMRQLEATVYLDLQTAQELYTWLRKKVALLEEVAGISQEDRVTTDESD